MLCCCVISYVFIFHLIIVYFVLHWLIIVCRVCWCLLSVCAFVVCVCIIDVSNSAVLTGFGSVKRIGMYVCLYLASFVADTWRVQGTNFQESSSNGRRDTAEKAYTC
jgi:hypothetical protein